MMDDKLRVEMMQPHENGAQPRDGHGEKNISEMTHMSGEQLKAFIDEICPIRVREALKPQPANANSDVWHPPNPRWKDAEALHRAPTVAQAPPRKRSSTL